MSTQKIQDAAIESRNIARGAVTIDKIADGTLDGKEIALNSNLVAIDVEDNGDIVTYVGEGGTVQDVELNEETGDISFVIEG